MPFGIKLAPEVFQKRIREAIQKNPGVEHFIYDFVNFSVTGEEHNLRLCKVLSKLQAAGWILNNDKCKSERKSINFIMDTRFLKRVVNQILEKKGISRILKPRNMTDIKRFLRVVGFFNKFIQNFGF